MDGHGSNDRGGLTFVFRFLQRLFLEPDAEFCRYVQNNREGLAKLGITVDEEIDLGALQLEYTRLFLGPEEHVPPYESAFREGRFWGQSAADVKKFIGDIGLQVDEEFTMPPDHIAIELEVLELILASGEPEAEEFYKRFFEEHLGWGFDLLGRLIPKTTSSFYKTSFEFAEKFLTSEKERLKA